MQSVTEPNAVVDAPTRRPASEWAAIALLAFLGVTAIGGGIALVFGTPGGLAPPTEWLNELPIVDSWLLPGLVLGVGFGVGSLLIAYAVLRRWDRAWLGVLIIGLGMVAWIGLELVYLRGFSWLQAVYGPLGLVLVGLAWWPPLRDSLAD